MLTTVFNLRDLVFNPHNDVYIGRGSKWGNPFRIGPDGDRDVVIAKFERWARANGLDKEARAELRGKRLGCYCKPSACHGDVLAKWANGGE